MTTTLSTAIAADLRAYLDRALEAERGIRVTCDSHNLAVSLRQRLYRFRKTEQDAAKELYPAFDDPMHGRTVYDRLTITVEGDAVLIRNTKEPEVEEL